MAPIKGLPFRFGTAVRNAAVASGPPTASSTSRAACESRSLANSGATAGIAVLSPISARRLHAVIFSKSDASEWTTATRCEISAWFGFSDACCPAAFGRWEVMASKTASVAVRWREYRIALSLLVWLVLNPPGIAHGAMRHPVGLFVAQNLFRGRVPAERSARPAGNAPQQGDDGRLASDGDIAGRFLPGANGMEPVRVMITHGNAMVVMAGQAADDVGRVAREVALPADVDPPSLADKDGAERLDGSDRIPTLGDDVVFGIEATVDDVQRRAVGIFECYTGRLARLRRNHFDRARCIGAQSPLYRIECMDAAAGQAAAAEVAADVPRNDVSRRSEMVQPVIEWPPRGWAKPQVPIERVRNGFGRQIGIAAGAVVDGVDAFDLSQNAIADQLACEPELSARSLLQADLAHTAVTPTAVTMARASEITSATGFST